MVIQEDPTSVSYSKIWNGTENKAFCSFVAVNKRGQEASTAAANHRAVDDLDAGENDRISDLLDLNSEPAVEDLTRQIMSQAKLWEAIQEANREVINQSEARAKHKFPISFSAQ